MGFIKDFMDTIKNNISMDLDFTGSGLCFNIGLKDVDRVKNKSHKKYFSMDICGLLAPIGGVTMVSLEHDLNNLLAPKFNNEVDMVLFLGGFFGNDNSHFGKPFAEFITECNEGEINFPNGYRLKYKTISPKELSNNDNSLNSLIISSTIMTKLLPSDINNYACVYDKSMYDDKSVIYNTMIDCIENDGYELIATNENGGLRLLSNHIATYLYMLSLRDIEKEVSELLGKPVPDIPINPIQQKAWIEALLQSIPTNMIGDITRILHINKGSN